jgi:hypothetical protein
MLALECGLFKSKSEPRSVLVHVRLALASSKEILGFSCVATVFLAKYCLVSEAKMPIVKGLWRLYVTISNVALLFRAK